jgi:putative aldouronate transport system permease protein
MHKKKKYTWFDYLLVLIFLLVLLMTFYPFMNVLALSLNDSLESIKNINIIIPSKWTTANYNYVFKDKNLIDASLLSVGRTAVGAFVSVMATSMLAYTLARKDFIARKLFTVIFVITMYVSGGIIPDYLLIIQTLGLKNNFLVYILPGLIWVYNMILIRSYIQGLPDALEEAAMLDGANDLQVFFKIIFPICKPVVATVTLFYAVGQWNSFMDTYLYAKKLPTLQYKLYEIMSQANMQIDTHSTSSTAVSITPMSIRMAVTVIATVPILIVYPFVQKYFVGGMTLGSVKA